MAERTKKSYDNILVGKRSPFALTESFKTIRTNILYTGKNETCPVYAITSASGGTGKSSIIANLAQSFAQLGKNVVLLDCDLRRPAQHKIFSVPQSTGVSEILAGIDLNIDKLAQHTLVENLDIIVSGRIPPNPAELLASDNMAKMIAHLKERYDVIFIDFPPVNIVSDSIIPTKLITGYIFTVRSAHDDVKSVSTAIESMKKVGSNIIGFVLNDVNMKVGRASYSKYNYGYSSAANRSYYGYDSGNN